MMEEKNRINTRPFFFFLLESITNIYIYIYILNLKGFLILSEGVPIYF